MQNTLTDQPPDTPPSEDRSEPICIHWFVNKGTMGAPGTYWQECEMCGKRLKEILAADRQQSKTAWLNAQNERLRRLGEKMRGAIFDPNMTINIPGEVLENRHLREAFDALREQQRAKLEQVLAEASSEEGVQ